MHVMSSILSCHVGLNIDRFEKRSNQPEPLYTEQREFFIVCEPYTCIFNII